MKFPLRMRGVNKDHKKISVAKGSESPTILIIVVVVAGKAGKTGPGQTKPRQGTTSKPAKPRQAGVLPTKVAWGTV